VRSHLDQFVRGTVEETLNSLLDAEADRSCGAETYERSGRVEIAARPTARGDWRRDLQGESADAEIAQADLRDGDHWALPEAEASVEEALIEMYQTDVSVRRVEDITEALSGTRVSPSTVSGLNQKIYTHIEEWRHRLSRVNIRTSTS